ncbi:uncharacterized protein LOC144709430 [Wolffia australiana]
MARSPMSLEGTKRLKKWKWGYEPARKNTFASELLRSLVIREEWFSDDIDNGNDHRGISSSASIISSCDRCQSIPFNITTTKLLAFFSRSEREEEEEERKEKRRRVK